MTNKRRILIVEDDPDTREMLIAVLKKKGHDVCSAQSRDEAWSMISFGEWQPQIILLDYCMRGMEAAEFIQMVATRNASQLPRIVLMTATAEAEERARRLGIPEILRKPFVVSDVLNNIESYAIKQTY